MPFIVTNADNELITDEYFTIKKDNVVCNKSFIPSMITQKISAIKQDCLCYVMHPVPLPIKKDYLTIN